MYGAHLSFTVFFPSLLALAAGNRARLSAVYTLFTLVYTTLMFPVGLVADRWPPRPLLVASALVYASGFALSALAGSVGHLVLSFGLLAALGMSAGYLVPTTAALRALPQRGGLAVGVASAGVGLGNLAVPPIAFWLVERLGWRGAFVALGGGILATVLLASLALGPGPEGEGARRRAPAAPLATGAILRAPQFWLLGLVCAAGWLPLFAIWAHLFPMALGRGMPPAAAAVSVGAFGVASLAGRLVWGPLSDRRGRPLTIGLCLVGQALAFGLLAARAGVPAFLVAVLLFGFASGGVMVLVAVFAADLFGAASTGRVVGGTVTLGGAVATLGPLLAGALHDGLGSYRPAFVLGAALSVVALLLHARLVARGTYRGPAA